MNHPKHSKRCAAGAAPELTFDEAEHAYHLGAVRLPSVTEIIRDAGLIDDTWFTEHARNRGSQVHKACQFLNEDDLHLESLDQELLPYVIAYQAFLRDTGFRVYRSEQRVVSRRNMFAGTLDIYGLLRRGVRAVIDVKTGAVPDWVGVQISAYMLALIEMGLGRPNERLGLQLRSNGTYRLRGMARPHKDDVRFFLELLEQRRRGEHGI
jgi:hypothetical protein